MKNISRYPALSKVLSLTLDEPLFQEAEVEGNFWALQEEGQTKFACEPKSLNLLLPEVSKEESESLPKQCQIKVKHRFEDEQAREATFYLTFDVQIQGFEQKPDGMYEPKYTATLKDYEYDA